MSYACSCSLILYILKCKLSLPSTRSTAGRLRLPMRVHGRGHLGLQRHPEPLLRLQHRHPHPHAGRLPPAAHRGPQAAREAPQSLRPPGSRVRVRPGRDHRNQTCWARGADPVLNRLNLHLGLRAEYRCYFSTEVEQIFLNFFSVALFSVRRCNFRLPFSIDICSTFLQL